MAKKINTTNISVKRYLKLFVLGVIVVAIPLTILVANTRQNTQSHASLRAMSSFNGAWNCSWPYQTVRYGSRGGCVGLLQDMLNVGVHGTCSGIPNYYLTVDSNFGTKTLSAVKDFQRRKHLTVDGIVGPKTWTAVLSCILPE